MLRCPLTRRPLRPLEDSQCCHLNRAIEAGEVYDNLGRQVEQPLSSALIDTDEEWIYPVRETIPQLLSGEAIAAKQLR